jgi:hypothetical protein
MLERVDLLQQLRAVDEQLAAVAPGAHLEARLRARLRAEASAAQNGERGSARRLPRPLIFAFAACAALIVLASGSSQPPEPSAVVNSPTAPLSVLPETKARDDAGPLDSPSREDVPRRPKAIPAPALQDSPSQPFREGPAPEHRSPMPPRAPSIAPWPRPHEEILEEGSLLPWTPSDPPRKEGWRPLLRPGVNLDSVPPPQPRPASAAAHPPPNRPRVPSHDTPQPQPAATAEPSTEPVNEPVIDCRGPDELKEEATLTCDNQGGFVTWIDFVDPCGDGRFRGVDFKCEPQEKPEPDTCSSHKLGGEGSCQDSGTLKWQAAEACKLANQQLNDLKYMEDGCPAGQATWAIYTCCSISPPLPPPPDLCFYGEIGDGTTCQDPTSLEQQAMVACKEAGLPLASTKSLQDCPGGFSSKLYYACCPLSPLQP